MIDWFVLFFIKKNHVILLSIFSISFIHIVDSEFKLKKYLKSRNRKKVKELLDKEEVRATLIKLNKELGFKTCYPSHGMVY